MANCNCLKNPHYKSRYMSACCCQEPTQIKILVNGDGTAAGNITLVSGCIVKLA